MAWCSLLENVASFFSHGGEKNVSRSRKRSFQVETLEERDMLSVSPFPTDPLALDFLASDTALVFTPPVFAVGTHSETTITETPTLLEIDSGTFLAGMLEQTTSVTIAMQATIHGDWLYCEVVTMSYTETYDSHTDLGATYSGGYTYTFTAWLNGTETGFTFLSDAWDDYTITDGDSLTITGFATSNIFLTSLSQPNLTFFEEQYENSATQITDFDGESGTFYTFEHATSSVSNTLTVTTQPNGNIATTLTGYETVTLTYNGNGSTISETPEDSNALVPSQSSLALTNYRAEVAFSYSGEEFYETTYTIFSVETPVVVNHETTYELLSLTGSSSTTVFSYQEWGDSTSLSYTLSGAGETYSLSTGNNVEGNATSDAEWSSELDPNGDWLLVSGTSHVFGHDYSALFSSVAFSAEKSEQDGSYTIFGFSDYFESDGEDYDLTETVSNGEWHLVSGLVMSQFERTTSNGTTITGDVTVTTEHDTTDWYTFDSSGTNESVKVLLLSEADSSGQWTTSGTRSSESFGSDSSTLTAKQETYQHTVNGMTIEGDCGSSEHYSVGYYFNIDESFDGENWGNATGDGWSLSSASSGFGWYAHCEVDKRYGTKLSSENVAEARWLDDSPLGNGESEIVVTGTFTERGYVSDSSTGELVTYTLVDGDWAVTGGETVLTSIRSVRMNYELTSDGDGITITEKGRVYDYNRTVVGYDEELGREKWGQATVTYTEYASIKVEYDNDSDGSDTFASYDYSYYAALVLMPAASTAESYADTPTVWTMEGTTSPIFAIELDDPEEEEDVTLEWKTIYWDATLTTVQKVNSSQTGTGLKLGNSSKNGSSTTVTIRDFGGMMDDFGVDDEGNVSPGGGSGSSGSGNGNGGGDDPGGDPGGDPGSGDDTSGSGEWIPATQTYKLVDGHNWDITTALTIGEMTGEKTLKGKVETVFFAVGDGTAWETYDYTNRETGSVSAATGTLEDPNYSISSYSYKNSLTEFYHTDFEYDEGWIAVGGNGAASGGRSWNASSKTKATGQVSTEGLVIGLCDVGAYFDWVNSVETTNSGGNYSDEWSSTATYQNDAWVLTGGTMSGSGNFYDKQSIHLGNEKECEGDLYQLAKVGSTTTHTIDETFSVGQTVSNGEWVTSSKSSTVVETLNDEWSRKILNGVSAVLSDGTYSSADHHYDWVSTEFTSTKVYGMSSSPESSEWTLLRQKSAGFGYFESSPYGTYDDGKDHEGYEYVSSSGETHGQYTTTRYTYEIGMGSSDCYDSVMIVTLGANGISGEDQYYHNGTFLYSYSINNSGAFQSGSDQSTAGSSANLAGDDKPAAPPPPQEKPAVTGAGMPPVDTSNWGFAKAVAGGLFSGFGSGAKGAANGLTQSAVDLVTLGTVSVNGPFTLSEFDISVGAGLSQNIARGCGSIAIGAGTGGLGCIGGNIGKAAKAYDLAGNAVQMGRAGADMYSNGVTVENAFQMAAGGLGTSANLSMKCFTEGTQIVVDAIYDENDVFVQYVTVNIEDIKVGDFVYSYDTITGTVEQKEVTAIFVRESDHINYLTIVDEFDNVQVIETTDSHPFWVVTDNPDLSRAARSVVDENGVILYHENIEPGLNGFWVEAKDLLVGDVFLGANGELTTLVDIERVQFDESIKVYNFTVDGNHNYFVIAKCDEYGQTCVLVHNANYWDDLVKGSNVLKPPKGTNAAIYGRQGGLAEATADFRSLNPQDVVLRPNGGMSGVLPDGTKINLHFSTTPGATQGAASLEIQTVPNMIKVRYQ